MKYDTKKRKKRTIHILYILIFILLIMNVMCLLLLRRYETASIYHKMCMRGYKASQEQMIASLICEELGLSNEETAYELAKEKGYNASEKEWIRTLTDISDDIDGKTPYVIACENGYEGSLTQWLTEIADHPEELGRSGDDKHSTAYEFACKYGYSGTFIEWLVSVVGDPMSNQMNNTKENWRNE